jgi:hypothetical protein
VIVALAQAALAAVQGSGRGSYDMINFITGEPIEQGADRGPDLPRFDHVSLTAEDHYAADLRAWGLSRG